MLPHVAIMSKTQPLDENTDGTGTISSTGWLYNDGYYMAKKIRGRENYELRFSPPLLPHF